MLAPPQQPGSGAAVVNKKPTIPTSEANKLKQQQAEQALQQQQAPLAWAPPDWVRCEERSMCGNMTRSDLRVDRVLCVKHHCAVID